MALEISLCCCCCYYCYCCCDLRGRSGLVVSPLTRGIAGMMTLTQRRLQKFVHHLWPIAPSLTSVTVIYLSFDSNITFNTIYNHEEFNLYLACRLLLASQWSSTLLVLLFWFLFLYFLHRAYFADCIPLINQWERGEIVSSLLKICRQLN